VEFIVVYVEEGTEANTDLVLRPLSLVQPLPPRDGIPTGILPIQFLALKYKGGITLDYERSSVANYI